MKLKQINIINFRCFRAMNVTLHPRVNVFAGINGAGKTAVLDAVATGLGPVLSCFPGVSGKKIKESDIRVHSGKRAEYAALSMFCVDGLNWGLTRRRDISVKITDGKTIGTQADLKNKMTEIIRAVNDDRKTAMPVIACYGTNRAVLDTSVNPRKFRDGDNRFLALGDALVAMPRFKAAFEWFGSMENLERYEQKERRDFDFELAALKTVRGAITKMIPEFSNPRLTLGPTRFMVDWKRADGGTEPLKLDQLSHGYLNLLALIMDLARRMVQANPSIDNPLKSEAIVLIDEIDLHLHPKWQQRVAPDLLRTFPGTQFIIATHSPHVISSCMKENIKIFSRDKESGEPRLLDYERLRVSKGVPAERILKDLMELETTRDPEIQERITALWNRIETSEFDSRSFISEYDELTRLLGALDEDLLLMNMEIGKKKWEKDKTYA